MESIGQLIKDEMKRQERSVSWMARKLDLDRSNVYRLFQRNSIDTDLLMKVSLALNVDYFAYFSKKIAKKASNATEV